MSKRNHYILLGNEIFDIQFFGVADDFRSPLIAVAIANLVDVLADDVQKQCLVGQDGFIALDFLNQFGVVASEFFDFKARQSL